MTLSGRLVRGARGRSRTDLTGLSAIGLTVLSGLLYILGYSLSKNMVAVHGLTPFQVTFLHCFVILLTSLLLIGWR